MWHGLIGRAGEGGWIHHSTSAELPRTSRRTTLSRSLTPLHCTTGASSCFSSAAGVDAEADMSPPASSGEHAGRAGQWSYWSLEAEKRRGRYGGLNWGISGQRLLESPLSAALGALNI